MELISEEKPEIAILTGPFVDIEHELVKEGELFYKNSNGEIDCFEDADIYKAIKNYLSKFVGNTKIMVIPSLNDASSLHPFPQPALTKNVDKKGNEITDLRFLSNPCRLRINGIDFAITNTGKNLKNNYLNRYCKSSDSKISDTWRRRKQISEMHKRNCKTEKLLSTLSTERRRFSRYFQIQKF